MLSQTLTPMSRMVASVFTNMSEALSFAYMAVNWSWPLPYFRARLQLFVSIGRPEDGGLVGRGRVAEGTYDAAATTLETGRTVVNFDLSAVGGNTHQSPSSCRKKNNARAPSADEVSTHT